MDARAIAIDEKKMIATLAQSRQSGKRGGLMCTFYSPPIWP
jgi:hypothetical protein